MTIPWNWVGAIDMNCPKCGGRLGVYDTNSFDSETARKRKCKQCGHICYTSEWFIDDDIGYDLISKRWKEQRLKRVVREMQREARSV